MLPAFNVTLTPRKSFFSLRDDNLEVAVSARYLFGEPVQGTAYVVFGIKINQEMIRLPWVEKVTDVSDQNPPEEMFPGFCCWFLGPSGYTNLVQM